MTTALVDGNALVWRAAYGMGTANQGVVTGVLNLLSDILGIVNPERLMVFWDEGKSRWRTLCYPEYKQTRAEKREKSELDIEEVFAQAKDAQRILNFYDVQQVKVTGVEADDLIGWFSEYYYETVGGTVVIVSSDKDLWQLICEGDDKQVICFDPMKKIWVNSDYVREFLGVLPSQVRDFKALSGDSSDNIPGAKGIGPKTAVMLLAKYGNLPSMFTEEAVKDLKSRKTTNNILFYSDEVESAYRVMDIPKLSEAKYVLSFSECQEIIKQISEPKKVDQVRTQIILDSLGSIRLNKERLPTRSAMSITVPEHFLQIYQTSPLTLEEVDQQVLACFKCKLRKDCGEGSPTLAEGFNDVEIMIIGRNPGVEELIEGRPFVGRSGQKLDKLLEEVGLTRRECWVTNVCKCHSYKDRPLDFSEMEACLPYLRSEILAIKPKLIVALGNEAMAAVSPYGCSGITKHAGEVLGPFTRGWVGEVESTVILFPHPLAALREQKSEALFQLATQKLKEFLVKHA